MDSVNVFNVIQFELLPITVDNIRRETKRDPVLSPVHEMMTKGRLSSRPPVPHLFHAHRNEITVHSGCLMWRVRVSNPKTSSTSA